jgi:hypothetical protein
VQDRATVSSRGPPVPLRADLLGTRAVASEKVSRRTAPRHARERRGADSHLLSPRRRTYGEGPFVAKASDRPTLKLLFVASAVPSSPSLRRRRRSP